MKQSLRTPPRAIRARLQAFDARIPFAVRCAIWSTLATLALPWALRAYGAWWNLALGSGGAFCETFLPLVR